MRKLCAFVMLCLLGLTGLVPASPLFTGGQSSWTVYVGKDVGSTVNYAAEEFVNAVQRVSGVRLPVVHERKGADQVLIGTASQLGVDGPRLGLFGKKDEIGIRFLDGKLYLAGSSPRGALYAVYTFLRQELGVRFLIPGPEGEFYPPCKAYEVPAKLSVNHVPSFQYRGNHLCWRHVDATYETWMARNFLNIMRSGPNKKSNDFAGRQKKGIHIMISDHHVFLPKEMLKIHPECFAEHNGVRHSRQLCLKNPLTEDLIYEKMAKSLRTMPEVEILSIFPSDNMDYCQCKLCRQQSVSTVWFDFYKRVCTRLHKEFPKVQFATLAYQGYLEAPETVLRDSAFIEYAQHDRCYMHRLTDKNCPSNAFAQKRMERWFAKKIPMGIYAYEFDIMAQRNSVMVPFYPILADGIRRYRDLGIRAVITEAWRDFPARLPDRYVTRQNAFGLYLYAQMLWNADADPEKLLSDWDACMFGAAAPMADQVMRKMALWYMNTKGHIGNFHNTPFGTASKMLNPKRLKELQDLLKAGEAVLKKQPASREVALNKKNLAFLKTCVLQWDQAYWFSKQSGMTLNLPFAADPAKPFEHALKLPPFRSKGGSKAKFFKTDVFMSWDAKYLNLRAYCYDDRMQDLKADCINRDEQVFNEDCIELFYSNPANTEGLYKHIIVNAKGTMMDAATVGPASYNTAWNPNTLVKTGRLPGNKGWTVELRIPHDANGPAPKAGEAWRGSIMRTNAVTRHGLSSSGYPDNSYHDPNSFATFHFNSKTDTSKRMLMLMPPKSDDIALKHHMLQGGWTCATVTDEAALPLDMEDYDVLIVRLPQIHNRQKMNHVKYVKDFLKRGKIVIYSSLWALPLEKYLEDPNLKLNISTWKTDKMRRNLNYTQDSWWMKPHNLYKLLKELMCPPWGYAGTDGGWRDLASLKLQDGRICPWMIVRPYGGGLLVVTGAEMGMAGGGVFLGNGNARAVPLMLENLMANQAELMKPVKK